jgi:hypothetical protein
VNETSRWLDGSERASMVRRQPKARGCDTVRRQSLATIAGVFNTSAALLSSRPTWW